MAQLSNEQLLEAYADAVRATAIAIRSNVASERRSRTINKRDALRVKVLNRMAAAPEVRP